MSEKSLIDTSGGEIVIQEKPIRVTDEKLNRMLSNTYECARKDARKFRLCDYYDVCFSISGTLIIPLLTSTFKDLHFIKSETLTTITWLICVTFLIIGIILTIIRASKRGNDELDDRNNAVNQIMKGILNDIEKSP